MLEVEVLLIDPWEGVTGGEGGYRLLVVATAPYFVPGGQC